MHRVATLTALLFVVLVGPAAATTVTYFPYVESASSPEESCSRYAACPPPRMVITAGSGETNDIAVTTESDRFVVRDAGAPVTPGSKECRSEPDGAVSCPVAGDLTMFLGDRDDRAAARSWNIDAGAGDDVVAGSYVAGGPGNDTLTGTELGDTLVGGPGRDVLDGLAGPDTLAEGEEAPEADVFAGGTGIDRIALTGRATPVLIDLGEPQAAGSAGEGNVVSGFEEAVGGDGDDTLLGSPTAVPEPTASPLFLIGGNGDDRLVDRGPDRNWLQGQSGDDTLLGAAGADRLEGGEGDDRLLGADGSDDLLGENGRDVLLGGGDVDRMIGGPGADGLDGGLGDDVLFGQEGRDRLLGREGADRIDGGPGVDLLLGGDGPDVLASRDGGTPDRASCGHGVDRLLADRRDRAAGCERVSRSRRR